MALFVAVVGIVVLWAKSPLRGMARLLSAEIVAYTMLASIFAVRPFFRDFSEGLYGQNVSPAYVQLAIGTGTLGMVSFVVGCLAARGNRNLLPQTRQRRPARYLAMGPSHLILSTVLGLGGYIVVLTALVGPASVAAMAGGRSSDVVTAGVPAIVMMLPMSGSIAAMIFILTQDANRKIGFVNGLLILSSTAVSLAALSQLGNRRFLIPALLMPVLSIFIKKRIPLRPQYVAAGVIGLLVIAIIPMVRSAGSRRIGESFVDSIVRYANEQGFIGIVQPIFASNDTEMLDYIALVMERMDRGLQPYGFGASTIGDFATASIPSSIYSGISFSDGILTRIWGGGCGQPACPVASVVGVSYFDGGLLAVVVACALFGWGMRKLSHNLSATSILPAWTSVWSIVASSYAIVLTRTNTINAIWWTIYAVFIAWLIFVFCSRRPTVTPTPKTFGRAINHPPTPTELSDSSYVKRSGRSFRGLPFRPKETSPSQA